MHFSEFQVFLFSKIFSIALKKSPLSMRRELRQQVNHLYRNFKTVFVHPKCYR